MSRTETLPLGEAHRFLFSTSEPFSSTPTGIGPNRAVRASNKASRGKPFVYDELLARMRAVLRRASGPRHARLDVRDLEIDLASRVVKVAGEPVQLSAKEYELLVALAEDPERVFKKEKLLRNVWGFRSLGRNWVEGAARPDM